MARGNRGTRTTLQATDLDAYLTVDVVGRATIIAQLLSQLSTAETGINMLVGIQYMELAPERAGTMRLRVCFRIGYFIPDGTEKGVYHLSVHGLGILNRIVTLSPVMRAVETSQLSGDPSWFRQECNRHLYLYGLEWETKEETHAE